MKQFARIHFAVCFAVLCYSGVIISQLHEADKIQLVIEYQVEPMFNSLMDKVFTGQVWPYDYYYQGPDIETLRHVTKIEDSLE